ncbi:hypothetical protein HDF22_004619 [Mucilaginibacter lappiensis]|uniref:Uncharacterized protein n=1 Tax=Mucilaginibacter lappiensis TaxID=354630 RepID=A0A841JH36_9SPHI|nr:hypothetical protein [Mucilaginibacter lappiensis]
MFMLTCSSKRTIDILCFTYKLSSKVNNHLTLTSVIVNKLQCNRINRIMFISDKNLSGICMGII